jgi:pimeloyl-ACP methyl ester carboxylesterase
MRLRGTAVALCLLAASASAAESTRLRRKVVAHDGAALALYRTSPVGGGASSPAVLLVADLGFGRESFEVQGEGLAPFFVRHGRDTFVAELRGQGDADAPKGWSLAAWASDLAKVVDAVSAVHPGPVDLVSHGYGAGLAIAVSSRELRGKVRRVVSLCGAVAPEVPNPVVRALLRERGTLSRAVADGTFELLFSRDGQVPREALRAVQRTGPKDLGETAAGELLRWMESGDYAFPDGTSVKQRLADYDVPTLVFLPLIDNYAHSEFAAPLRELAPKARVRLLTLSKLYLHREDYAHLSLLHGQGAPSDVFMPALKFLEAP